MLSVKATYDGKVLTLPKGLEIKRPHQVIVVFLDDLSEEGEEPLTAKSLQTMLAENPAFDFLASEEEDIYSEADLKVKY